MKADKCQRETALLLQNKMEDRDYCQVAKEKPQVLSRKLYVTKKKGVILTLTVMAPFVVNQVVCSQVELKPPLQAWT